MDKANWHYARYAFIRGHQALWRGEPTEEGSLFVQIVITSDEWLLMTGSFQVYALEGLCKGVVDGILSAEPNLKIVFDGDFESLEAAYQKLEQIVLDAEAQGYEKRTGLHILDLESKLRYLRDRTRTV